MIYYAVIDTNVLVSALLSSQPTAATVQVFKKLFEGSFIPLFNDEILKEYNDVLKRKKFSFDEALIDSLINSIHGMGKNIITSPSGEILPDMKDIPFYEVVLEERENDAYLVTGNIKHFPLKPYIVTPREFLNILLNNETATVT